MSVLDGSHSVIPFLPPPNAIVPTLTYFLLSRGSVEPVPVPLFLPAGRGATLGLKGGGGCAGTPESWCTPIGLESF